MSTKRRYRGMLIFPGPLMRPPVEMPSKPGKPMDNCHIESFNGTFRTECLNSHYFETLTDAREIIAAWWSEYNTERPQKRIKGMTPSECEVTCTLCRKVFPRFRVPDLSVIIKTVFPFINTKSTHSHSYQMTFICKSSVTGILRNAGFPVVSIFPYKIRN